MKPLVAVATSEHPIAAHAVAECAGSLLERSPTGFGDLLCFVGPPFGGALVDIAGALAELLGASGVAGMESQAVLMGARTASGTPALSVVAFAPGHAALGYLDGVAPGASGAVEGAREQGSPVPGHLRILFADPFSGPCAPSSAAGGLPTEASLVGGCLSGAPNGAAGRLLHAGIEHRRGAIFVDVVAGSASVHLVHGTEAVADAVTVTSVSDGQVVALDDAPAAELLESAVRSMDHERLQGVKQVGFVAAGDGRLVAARRAPLGLATSVPLTPGTRLHPAVCSRRAFDEQLRAAIGGCVGGIAIVFGSEELDSAVSLAEYPQAEKHSGIQLTGPLTAGVLWGTPAHYETVRRCLLVVGIDPASPPAGGGRVCL